MSRQRFELSQEQIEELTGAYSGSKDGPTRSRYQAVRLYGTGYPVAEVMAITGCSRTSLLEWCAKYRNQGRAGLVDQRAGGNCRKLTPHQIMDLAERLHQYTPAQLWGGTAATLDGQFWTVLDLRRAVQTWYGVVYDSPGSYHRLFTQCGFSYQRAAKVYKSRAAAQVAEFEGMVEKN